MIRQINHAHTIRNAKWRLMHRLAPELFYDLLFVDITFVTDSKQDGHAMYLSCTGAEIDEMKVFLGLYLCLYLSLGSCKAS